MRKQSATWCGLALLAAMPLLLPSCTSENTPPGMTTGNSSTAPRTPVRTVVALRTFSLGALQNTFLDVEVSSGTLDAVVNWTFATNDVDVYATTPACPSANELVLGGCSTLARGASVTKPERVSFSVTAGTYRFFVINYGPGGESGTIEVGLTQ